jgi:hypothetical protein
MEILTKKTIKLGRKVEETASIYRPNVILPQIISFVNDLGMLFHRAAGP